MAIVYGTRFNITTNDKWIPEIWAKQLIVARESKMVMGKLVKRYDVDNTDTLHIPLLSNLAAPEALGADGDVADVTPSTEDEVQIAINQKPAYILNIPEELSLKAQYDLLKDYTEKAGYGIALSIEQNLLGLYSGLTTNVVGDNLSDISDIRILRAIQKLDEARVPFEDRHFVMSPSQKVAMLSIDKFVRADAVPFMKGDSPIVTGQFGDVYGVKTYVSPEVILLAGERKNLMFHREAFGLAMLSDIQTKELASPHFARRVGCRAHYGFAELRDDHAVLVKSAP